MFWPHSAIIYIFSSAQMLLTHQQTLEKTNNTLMLPTFLLCSSLKMAKRLIESAQNEQAFRQCH